MGQPEILKALNNLRAKNDNWHTAKGLKQYMIDNKMLRDNGSGMSQDLLRLALFKLIEIKGVGLWNHHKEFRGLIK